VDFDLDWMPPHALILALSQAWSSERQAVQVFCLLETVYHAFDVIAKHRGVFKVKTIGDSYVDVVGLPTLKDLHAVIMARFARDIRNRMVEVVTELEKSLGPGRCASAMACIIAIDTKRPRG
jgi:class 3 adenylate cyclase